MTAANVFVLLSGAEQTRKIRMGCTNPIRDYYEDCGMFEGVDNIDWESFGKTHIAVGMPTRKIPDCIHNMLNENQKNREYAIAGLLGEGQHLGMLSEATPSIIPFVLEALALPDYAERSYLIMGLALMFDDMFQSQVFNRLRLEIRVYDEIKKGYPVYKRLLS